MAKTIQDLRKEKGYRSGREFADALGISPSSMSRYDKQPDTIPTKVAWAMADALGCSIDEVVGREHVTAGKGGMQELYDGLSEEGRALMDEFAAFVRGKDERARRQRDAEEARKYDAFLRYYERLFLDSLVNDASFGEVIVFGSPEEQRAAFEEFVCGQAEGARPQQEGANEEKDAEVIAGIMAAYDRAHASGAQGAFEYASITL